MKEELEEKLFGKYPKIFSGKDKPITENLMSFGFECGDGWFWLLDQLCEAIQRYCDSRNEGVRIRNEARKDGARLHPPESEWEVKAVQVKEKFGSLRFYIDSGDDVIYGMIDLAEHMSYGICENCGSTEDVTPSKSGWIRVRCKECHRMA